MEHAARGERHVSNLRAPVDAALREAGLRIDYITIADADELEPFDDGETIGERAVLALAAFAGPTRLIDNVVFGEDAPPIPSNPG